MLFKIKFTIYYRHASGKYLDMYIHTFAYIYTISLKKGLYRFTSDI